MEPGDVAPGSDVESRWFDVRTAAKYLCMTRHAIYHRINRCQLPFTRDGRRVRFDRDALDRWANEIELDIRAGVHGQKSSFDVMVQLLCSREPCLILNLVPSIHEIRADSSPAPPLIVIPDPVHATEPADLAASA